MNLTTLTAMKSKAVRILAAAALAGAVLTAAAPAAAAQEFRGRVVVEGLRPFGPPVRIYGGPATRWHPGRREYFVRPEPFRYHHPYFYAHRY